jgi:hypothetical protein
MRAARIDANQPDIVAALRKAGCTVQPLHAVGDGVPDLLVGRDGRNYLIEVKDGRKPPSSRRLTPVQKRWHNGDDKKRPAWAGQVAIANNVDEALRIVGVLGET